MWTFILSFIVLSRMFQTTLLTCKHLWAGAFHNTITLFGICCITICCVQLYYYSMPACVSPFPDYNIKINDNSAIQ